MSEDKSPETLPAPWMALPVWASFADLLAARGEMLTVKDLGSNTYVFANRAFGDFVGRAASEVPGRTDAEFFDQLTCEGLRTSEHAAASRASTNASDHEVSRSGQRHLFTVQRAAVSAPQGAGRWLVSLWRDARAQQQQAEQLRTAFAQIEEQHRQNQQLRRELAEQASRDLASGLHSRAHFDEHLRREVDLSQREHREFAVVFVAVDDDASWAKHADAAERVLAALGQLLRAGTRAMDASCRWSDDRFAVLLSGVGLATAHSRMEGLRRQCATQIVVLDGEPLRFTVSMGVASFPHTADGSEALLRAGETALQGARRRGGNQVTLASIRLDGA
jgi:diguanylate cyclase (GGDEF)-like protein